MLLLLFVFSFCFFGIFSFFKNKIKIGLFLPRFSPKQIFQIHNPLTVVSAGGSISDE
jgi:hypothetical protein